MKSPLIQKYHQQPQTTTSKTCLQLATMSWTTWKIKRINWKNHPGLFPYKPKFGRRNINRQKESIGDYYQKYILDFWEKANSQVGLERTHQKRKKGELLILYSRLMTTKYIMTKIFDMKVEDFDEDLKQLFTSYGLK